MRLPDDRTRKPRDPEHSEVSEENGHGQGGRAKVIGRSQEGTQKKAKVASKAHAHEQQTTTEDCDKSERQESCPK